MWQNNFSSNEISRYQRQLILKQLGPSGQQLLKDSKVLVIGAGGLGSPVLYYLVAAGIGTIGIVDHDTVELSNLNRQILHLTQDIGKNKTDSAKTKLSDLNPEVVIKTYQLTLDQDNIKEIVTHYDVVVDAVDNFDTRYLINDVCYKLKIPVVEGAVLGFVGTCTTIDPKHTSCYRCLYPSISEDLSMQTCKEIGIVGAVAGVIGSIQALEVIKICANIETPLHNRMLFFDGLDMDIQFIQLQRNHDCEFCK